jgi:isopenicillin N synthase-like dioxygenase
LTAFEHPVRCACCNDTATGLELTNVEGNWCEAPGDIGTFTVILGDMVEQLSNNYLKATGHRVVNTPWMRHRQ